MNRFTQFLRQAFLPRAIREDRQTLIAAQEKDEKLISPTTDYIARAYALITSLLPVIVVLGEVIGFDIAEVILAVFNAGCTP